MKIVDKAKREVRHPVAGLLTALVAVVCFLVVLAAVMALTHFIAS